MNDYFALPDRLLNGSVVVDVGSSERDRALRRLKPAYTVLLRALDVPGGG
jgi:hypothetical protein